MGVVNIPKGVEITGSTGTLGVYLDSTAGTIRVGDIPGSVAVYFSPSSPTILGITNTIGVYLSGTAGTLGVRVGQVDGSIAVHLVGTGGTLGVRVGQIDGTTAVYLHSTGGTLGVNVGKIEGTTAIFLQGTGGTLGVRVGQIDGSASVYLSGTAGTLGVNVGKIDDNVSVKFATVSGTAGVNLGKVDGTIQVNVGKISDTIAIWLTGTSGTLNVRLADNSAGLITDDTAFTPATDVGFPAMGLFDDTATDSVDEGDAGILRMTINRLLMMHSDSTASIFTASGTANGVSASGNTIISPSANASFKVYAYAIQTTGIVSLASRFTNGAGTGPIEFWRPFVTPATTTSETRGANLSTAGPGNPLFATGVNTTLALLLDTATLVHYSVAYTKESA